MSMLWAAATMLDWNAQCSKLCTSISVTKTATSVHQDEQGNNTK